jgi:hypothetical protein
VRNEAVGAGGLSSSIGIAARVGCYSATVASQEEAVLAGAPP